MRKVPAGFLHPLRRPHLCRLPVAGRNAGFRTAKSGETSSPKKNPRSPRRSRSFAATTNTTCSMRTFGLSMPRWRCWRNGTITRSPTIGVRARSYGTATSTERLVARRARMPRVPRIHADARDARRGRTGLSQDPLWSVARCLHARHAVLSHRQQRGRVSRRNPRPNPDGLAQTRIATFAGHLEGDRRRSANRSGQCRRGRARRWPAVQPRMRNR